MRLKFFATGFLTLASFSPALACSGENCANGLVTSSYGKGKTLAVFVHGDVSSGGAADYMYPYAKNFARNGVVAVAILRPGYYDKAGNTSAGSDNGRRDGYSSGNINALASAIRELKAKHGATKVIGLGHSGGAAMLGVLAGKGGVLDGAVLVSCPCDLQKWRASRGRGSWSSSQSPSDYASGVSIPVVAVTGSGDDNTSPELAQDYIEKLKSRGISAQVKIVSGGHNFGGGLASTAVSALSGMAR
jgi:predicted esterase